MCIVLRCTDAWLPSLLHKKRIGYSTMCGHRINALVTALLETRVGPYEAIVPEVSGTAFITGRHEFLIDPRDELGRGFLIV
jgi:proline racemase